MRFWKYSNNQNVVLITTLYMVLFVCYCAQVFTLALYGLLYMHQAFLTTFYSLIYLLICVSFDEDIMKFSEEGGFLLHTSRKLKFNILFYSLGLFVLASMIVGGMDDSWSNDRTWVKNVIHVSIKCYYTYFTSF